MTTDTDLRALRILHFSLVAGSIAFLAVFTLARRQPDATDLPDLEHVFQLAGALAMTGVVVAFITFKRLLQQASIRNVSTDRFAAVRAALIVHWALIEGICMLNGIFYFLSGSLLNLGLAIAALVVLISRAPTRERLEKWMLGIG